MLPTTIALAVKSTVPSQRMAVLLQHITVKEITHISVIAHSGPEAQPLSLKRGLLVLAVLSRSIASADCGVVWTWEEVCSHAGAGVVMCLARPHLRIE